MSILRVISKLSFFCGAYFGAFPFVFYEEYGDTYVSEILVATSNNISSAAICVDFCGSKYFILSGWSGVFFFATLKI